MVTQYVVVLPNMQGIVGPFEDMMPAMHYVMDNAIKGAQVVVMFSPADYAMVTHATHKPGPGIMNVEEQG